MSRQERIAKALSFIKSHENEYHFDALYALLNDEYDAEYAYNSDLNTNHYLNNLRQTKEKQAAVYMSVKRKRPVKGAPLEFRDFLSNFRHDVGSAMHHD
jgi:hypothetical protein